VQVRDETIPVVAAEPSKECIVDGTGVSPGARPGVRVRTPLGWREWLAFAALGVIYVALSIAEYSQRAGNYQN